MHSYMLRYVDIGMSRKSKCDSKDPIWDLVALVPDFCLYFYYAPGLIHRVFLLFFPLKEKNLGIFPNHFSIDIMLTLNVVCT